MVGEVADDELVVVAGPNGSGKTTVVSAYIDERFPRLPKLNADAVALELRGADAGLTGDELAERAASIVDARAHRLAGDATPFVIETVLSSDKYRGLVELARARGLIFRLVYITTVDPATNVERVRQRVASGGHDVPEDRIRSRWTRSMDNLPWFAVRADRLLVADNSGEAPVVLALRHLGGPIELARPAHPASQRLARHVGSQVVLATTTAP